MVSKAEIRKVVEDRIRHLTSEQRRMAAEKIKELICALREFIKSRVVMVYLAKEDEVDTTPIVDCAEREGKELVVPVVRGDEIKPCRLEGKLRKGTFGILEPEVYREVDIAKLDMVLVPGRAFDRHGNRIGRGKGYYDRFLAQLPPNVIKIGVCFSCQIFDSLPVQSTDIPVDLVVSA